MRFHLENKIHTLLLSLLFIWGSSALFAQDFPPVPNPPRLVNDYTGTLSAQEANRLEQKLVAYSDSTSTQIAIVLMRSVGQYDISDYAFQLGDLWGIGGKNDNGILILGAMEDRKVFIATGYGMEGVVPDALAKRIVSNLIIPNFKMESYFEGLDQATDMIIKLASGEYQAEEVVSDGNQGGGFLILLIFLILFVILPLIKNRKDNDNHMGGKGGGIDLWTTIMLANMLKGGNRGKYGDFSSGGGSFGGFGGGGGGFGGFGGGSFGGGGAGGSW
ncbi:TPM domain-containing protein [Algoriphagus sp. CAU 1675]|uniref:TPM domain-containing protein n=1 Tax=Algoriphagus sp. CAU 1675 TaxID=3032597 RepID=UPI0023DAA5D5|nr:TPM domain-containing protein [Algoriphagus sp. CAU 1675]MDF2156558.1 TPM domain-containing protein [Algoriphagus sp. CAU 1675]